MVVARDEMELKKEVILDVMLGMVGGKYRFFVGKAFCTGWDDEKIFAIEYF